MTKIEETLSYISYPQSLASSPKEEFSFETPESSKSSQSRKLRRFAQAESPIPRTLIKDTQIPYRDMWEQNGGYCGESSFIGAGMLYGQYCSQYDVRSLANGSYGQPETDQQDMTVIGKNDTTALDAMHLSYNEWNSDGSGGDSQDFLNWVKQMVTAGYPVSIGLYMNSSVFSETRDDPNYDHIVTVTGITTRVVNGKSEDCLVFNDESLYSNLNEDLASAPSIPGVTSGPEGGPYTFTIPFSELLQTRVSADTPDAPIYSLNKDGDDYGVAITGIQDPNDETVPVSVTSNSDSEGPGIQNKSNTRPPSQPTTLTVSVADLEPGKTYNLYMYNSFNKVPDSDFNDNAANAIEMWTVTANDDGTITYTAPDGSQTNTLNVSIQSSDMAIFRCTPA